MARTRSPRRTPQAEPPSPISLRGTPRCSRFFEAILMWPRAGNGAAEARRNFFRVRPEGRDLRIPGAVGSKRRFHNPVAGCTRWFSVGDCIFPASAQMQQASLKHDAHVASAPPEGLPGRDRPPGPDGVVGPEQDLAVFVWCLCVYISVCLSVRLSFCLCLSPSVSVCLCMYAKVCLEACDPCTPLSLRSIDMGILSCSRPNEFCQRPPRLDDLHMSDHGPRWPADLVSACDRALAIF